VGERGGEAKKTISNLTGGYSGPLKGEHITYYGKRRKNLRRRTSGRKRPGPSKKRDKRQGTQRCRKGTTDRSVTQVNTTSNK